MLEKLTYPAPKVLCFLFSLLAFSVFSQDNISQSPYGSGYFSDIERASENPEKVTALNLYDKHLLSFPEVIFSMPNIEILDLSHNSISGIPERISELKKLRSLYINHNNIGDLPDALLQMNSLKILYIQVNPLNNKKNIADKIPVKLDKLESGNPSSDFVSPKPEFNRPDSVISNKQ